MFIKSHAMALSLRRLYRQTPRRLYLQTPAVTRVYVTACVLTTAAVQLGLVTPVQLSFNLQMVIRKWQIWRLITHFFFFGSLGFGFLINIIFLFRYCRLLEEGCFRNQTADFVFLFLFGGVLMTALGVFTDQVFLGQSFPSMLVYLWSRRNPDVQIHFLGLLSFDARFLPWGLMGFSLLLGNPIMVDVLGIVVGQAYFCLMDLLPNQPGRKLLRTPQVL